MASPLQADQPVALVPRLGPILDGGPFGEGPDKTGEAHCQQERGEDHRLDLLGQKSMGIDNVPVQAEQAAYRPEHDPDEPLFVI